MEDKEIDTQTSEPARPVSTNDRKIQTTDDETDPVIVFLDKFVEQFRVIGPDKFIELLLSLVLVISTVVNVRQTAANNRSTSGQTKEVIDGIGKAVEELKAQAMATQNQLDAFKSSANSVSLTEATVNLPVISPTFNGISMEIENGKAIYKMKQEWTNLGGSRAIGPIMRWGWGQKEPGRFPRYRYVTELFANTTLVNHYPIRDTRTLTDDDVATLKNFSPAHPLYAYGRIDYTDAFATDLNGIPRPNKHVVRYKIKIIKVTMGGKDDTGWTGEEVPYGYCYDEKCAQHPQ